jgi:hypothetical protein
MRLLTYDEAEQVASNIAKAWPGLTGEAKAPDLLQIADLVQRVMRLAEAVITLNDGGDV